MEIIPVQEYLQELTDKWERVQIGYGEDRLSADDWGKWCHSFNKNLKEKVKVLLQGDETHKSIKEVEFGIASLQAIFRLWQLQYHMATLKVGMVVGRSKMKKFKKEYLKIMKEAKVQIFRYEKVIKQRDIEGVNNRGGYI